MIISMSLLGVGGVCMLKQVSDENNRELVTGPAQFSELDTISVPSCLENRDESNI